MAAPIAAMSANSKLRTMPASTTGEIACDTGSAAIARARGLSSRALARLRAAATAEAAALCAVSARTAGVSCVIIVNQTTPAGRCVDAGRVSTYMEIYEEIV